MIPLAWCLGGAAVGVMVSALTALVPGLHVYNLMALGVLGLHACSSAVIPYECILGLFAGLLAGFAFFNTLPSVFLSAPDESAVFTVLPGQRYLMEGRAVEAVALTTIGAAAGLLVVIPVFAVVVPRVLETVRQVTQPHLHWMVWAVIAFMLMSEWPKGGRMGASGWRRLADAWRATGAGVLTFVLAGGLGFVMFYRPPLPAETGFQNLMPVFIGLFTIPGLVINFISRVQVPVQESGREVSVGVGRIIHGSLAGTLGGLFAAFVPGVTGGVGGMLAGHAASIRDSQVFLVSQGASRAVYYVGGFLLAFVPGSLMMRGGAAWMLRGIRSPSDGDYPLLLVAVACAAGLALAMMLPASRWMARWAHRVPYRRVSGVGLVLAVALVWGVTGAGGLGVMAVATAIGLVPLLYGARRMNALAVILVPLACNMSGVGPAVAGWLGLL
jgi:putative membrane protein